VLPTPEAGIRSIGATIRAARIARGLTQERAAKEARVSRAQLALLEQGGNVSIKFLLKIAKLLDLTNIPLDGKVQLTAEVRDGLNVFELMQSLDLLAAVVDHLRGFAMTAVLPPSERGELKDTVALKEIVARHTVNAAGVERLAKAITQLEGAPVGAPLPGVVQEKETQRRTSGRVRKRGSRELPR